LVGVGYGCAYTPPIQALLEWFPDRRGLASGIVISGFGSGALFYAPLMNIFTKNLSTMPTYLGNSVRGLMQTPL
jgi:OFA family oxalate/formate antiporter-like MFS transporter